MPNKVPEFPSQNFLKNKAYRQAILTDDTAVLEKIITESTDLPEKDKEYLKLRLKTMKKIQNLETKKNQAEDQKWDFKDQPVTDEKGDTVLPVVLKEKQTTGNGCWSVSLSLLLQAAGVDVEQEEIRSFRPKFDKDYIDNITEDKTDWEIMTSDASGNAFDYSDLVMRTVPNTAVRHIAYHPVNADNRDAIQADMEKMIDDAVNKQHTPVSLLKNNGGSYGHYLTIIGYKKGQIKVADSANSQADYRWMDLNEVLTYDNIELTWLQRLTVSEDGKVNGIPADFQGVSYENGTLNPGNGYAEQGSSFQVNSTVLRSYERSYQDQKAGIDYRIERIAMPGTLVIPQVLKDKQVPGENNPAKGRAIDPNAIHDAVEEQTKIVNSLYQDFVCGRFYEKMISFLQRDNITLSNYPVSGASYEREISRFAAYYMIQDPNWSGSGYNRQLSQEISGILATEKDIPADRKDWKDFFAEIRKFSEDFEAARRNAAITALKENNKNATDNAIRDFLNSEKMPSEKNPPSITLLDDKTLNEVNLPLYNLSHVPGLNDLNKEYSEKYPAPVQPAAVEKAQEQYLEDDVLRMLAVSDGSPDQEPRKNSPNINRETISSGSLREETSSGSNTAPEDIFIETFWGQSGMNVWNLNEMDILNPLDQDFGAPYSREQGLELSKNHPGVFLNNFSYKTYVYHPEQLLENATILDYKEVSKRLSRAHFYGMLNHLHVNVKDSDKLYDKILEAWKEEAPETETLDEFWNDIRTHLDAFKDFFENPDDLNIFLYLTGAVLRDEWAKSDHMARAAVMINFLPSPRELTGTKEREQAISELGLESYDTHIRENNSADRSDALAFMKGYAAVNLENPVLNPDQQWIGTLYNIRTLDAEHKREIITLSKGSAEDTKTLIGMAVGEIRKLSKSIGMANLIQLSLSEYVKNFDKIDHVLALGQNREAFLKAIMTYAADEYTPAEIQALGTLLENFEKIRAAFAAKAELELTPLSSVIDTEQLTYAFIEKLKESAPAEKQFEETAEKFLKAAEAKSKIDEKQLTQAYQKFLPALEQKDAAIQKKLEEADRNKHARIDAFSKLTVGSGIVQLTEGLAEEMPAEQAAASFKNALGFYFKEESADLRFHSETIALAEYMDELSYLHRKNAPRELTAERRSTLIEKQNAARQALQSASKKHFVNRELSELFTKMAKIIDMDSAITKQPLTVFGASSPAPTVYLDGYILSAKMAVSGNGESRVVKAAYDDYFKKANRTTGAYMGIEYDQARTQALTALKDDLEKTEKTSWDAINFFADKLEHLEAVSTLFNSSKYNNLREKLIAVSENHPNSYKDYAQEMHNLKNLASAYLKDKENSLIQNGTHTDTGKQRYLFVSNLYRKTKEAEEKLRETNDKISNIDKTGLNAEDVWTSSRFTPVQLEKISYDDAHDRYKQLKKSLPHNNFIDSLKKDFSEYLVLKNVLNGTKHQMRRFSSLEKELRTQEYFNSDAMGLFIINWDPEENHDLRQMEKCYRACEQYFADIQELKSMDVEELEECQKHMLQENSFLKRTSGMKSFDHKLTEAKQAFLQQRIEKKARERTLAFKNVMAQNAAKELSPVTPDKLTVFTKKRDEEAVTDSGEVFAKALINNHKQVIRKLSEMVDSGQKDSQEVLAECLLRDALTNSVISGKMKNGRLNFDSDMKQRLSKYDAHEAALFVYERSDELKALTAALSGNQEMLALVAPFIMDGSISGLFKLETIGTSLFHPVIKKIPTVSECCAFAKEQRLLRRQATDKARETLRNERRKMPEGYAYKDMQNGLIAMAMLRDNYAGTVNYMAPGNKNEMNRIAQCILKANWMVYCQKKGMTAAAAENNFSSIMKLPYMNTALTDNIADTLRSFEDSAAPVKLLKTARQKDAKAKKVIQEASKKTKKPIQNI